MKKLLIVLTVVVISCTSSVQTENEVKDVHHENERDTTAMVLNAGSKWKADEATKKNVASMVQIVNDSSYNDANKKMQLSANLQSQLDNLIKQCSMKGAEHDALHVWLQKVIKDMKELKEEDKDYYKVHAALKKDIESFYSYFE